MRIAAALVLFCNVLGWHGVAAAASTGDAERGGYVLRLAGCVTCHTEKGGTPLAGGRALTSPFGTFYPPNITPDPETGIGNWSDDDFVRALDEGKSPEGSPYYPAFPYTSYTRMTRQDMVDLKAYLDTVEPVRKQAPEHDLDFPFGIRSGLYLWRALFFDNRDPVAADPAQSAAWNRGAYIVSGPGHCGECHSPRNFLGVVDDDRPLAGNRNGPEGKPVPNITGHEKGLGAWSADDIVSLLEIGFKPDGDFVGGAMGDVVDDATGELTDADLQAIASYLKSLPPIPPE